MVLSAIVIAAYFSLVIGNLALIIAGSMRNQKVLKLINRAVWIDGAFLLVSVIPLVMVLNEMRNSVEAGLALPAVLFIPSPILVELVALLAVRRWRLQAHSKP